MAESATANGSRPPVRELGGATQLNNTSSLFTWSSLSGMEDSLERTPALVFPQSILTYSDMMNDAQMEGLTAAVTLPILSMNWFLKPNGAAQRAIDRISESYGLSIEGARDDEHRRRSKGRFKFLEHAETALEALWWGFQYFEIVGEIGNDGQWRLRKLAPRLPHTIGEINVEPDGGLRSIKQGVSIEAPEIPVESLVAYVWRRRGANWVGRSMMRPCYGAWLLKGRVLRVGAINIERNGAGTPVIEAPPGATGPEIEALDRMAQRLKAGSRSGGAVPNGAKVNLLGINGTQPQAEAFVELCNEEMARSFLAMFMQLGQTKTGSRALGEAFIDFFTWKLEAVAGWFADIFNEHVIEDDVEWNEGEEAPAPLLEWSWGDSQVPAEHLVTAVESGLIQVDEELESAIRNQWRLPLRTRPRVTPPAPGSTGEGEETEGEAEPSPEPVAARGKRRGRASRSAAPSPAALPLPARPLRRQPYAHEIAASTDFASIDSAWQSTLELLLMEIRQLQSAQIDEIHDAIVAAGGDLEAVSEVGAEPMASDVIAQRLSQLAELSMASALAEANRQGRQLTKPNMDNLHRSLATRAEAVDNVITRELSDSAVRTAVRLSGGGLDAVQVADSVKEHLLSLSGAGMRDRLGGALTAAQNGARGLLFRQGNAQRIYASELLDNNTCSPCVGIDGTEYENMSAAEQDYATGGFNDCAGGDRCRGTLVAVWSESEGGEA